MVYEQYFASFIHTIKNLRGHKTSSKLKKPLGLKRSEIVRADPCGSPVVFQNCKNLMPYAVHYILIKMNGQI